MNLHAVFHKVNSEYNFPVSPDITVVRLRVARGECADVTVITHNKYRHNRGERTSRRIPMKLFASNELFDFYEAEIDQVENGARYVFKLAESLYYGAYQFYAAEPEFANQFFVQPYIAVKDIFTVPRWCADAVVYQIFPERFHTGGVLPDNWNAKVSHDTFLGGTIRGIISKLDYLEKLGVNCIYLTPIFESKSNHKYDIIDYYKIDPSFGTKEDLVELSKRVHGKGLRLVLDAVFNQVALDFAPFHDLRKNGAESEYRTWFDVKEFPVEVKDFPAYATFGYYGYMPKLMTANPDTREYLIGAAEYWTKECDLDGWRIDVADEIEHDFWRAFRARLKKINPEILIVGELWGDAGAWLKGDQFDTVMNYPFMNMLSQILAKKQPVSLFYEGIGFMRTLYQRAPWSILWNLIGSHDTPRFLTRCSADKRMLRIAALIQMTLPGSPFIYYGDELAMEGGCDPDCRGGMAWDEGDYGMFEYYRTLINARSNNPVLRRGDMNEIRLNENVIAYRMSGGDDEAVILINLGDKDFVYPFDGVYSEIIRGSAVSEKITLTPQGAALLIRRG